MSTNFSQLAGDRESRYSISTIGTYRNSSDMQENSPIIQEESPSATKRSRGLINRMLGRAASPTNDMRNYGSISIGSPATLFAPVPIKHVGQQPGSRDSSPRPSLNLSRPSTPLATIPPTLPPTTNTLSNAERAEKIRRNRKVLQILGDVPFDTGARATGDLAHDNAAALYHDLSPTAFKTPRHLRRHSSPISPVFPREAIISPRVLRRQTAAARGTASPEPSSHSRSSRESYFDFDADDLEELASMTPIAASRRVSISAQSIASISTVATVDSTPAISAAAEERARKRATLSKLHRFLGSRVPPELVLGIPINEDEDLPHWLKPKATRKGTGADSSAAGRSSTEGEGPTAYMSDGELGVRSHPRLSGAEKARIVKKKKKITKMLGECPPAALNDRPGAQVLPILPSTPGRSEEYTRHRYSINSLAYLVKNNDQEQLEDLFTYIRTDDKTDAPLPLPRRASIISTTPSIASADPSEPPSPTASFLSLASTLEEPSDFQNRRKRAAKLVGFFGVEYVELFSDVLDTIESEVQNDRARGSLTAAEVQELLSKLRTLKI